MTKCLSRPPRLLGVALTCALTAGLAACNEDTFDVESQIGPNPVLPAPQQYLFPPMKLASVVGWKEGETPSVPQA